MATIESHPMARVSQAAEFAKELSERREQSAARARQLEDEAADLRAVERACAAAVEAMDATHAC